MNSYARSTLGASPEAVLSLDAKPRDRPVVSFPVLPNVHTDGQDMQGAMEEAIDCLGSHLAERIATRLDIPSPSEPLPGQQMVPVPLWIAGKLALCTALREQNMSTGQLSQLVGVRESVVRQMLDPAHDTRGEKLQTALQRLGKQLVVDVVDAA